MKNDLCPQIYCFRYDPVSFRKSTNLFSVSFGVDTVSVPKWPQKVRKL